MSLHYSPQWQTRSGHLPKACGRSEIERAICLSRQKLRFESARDEPDLRKLLAHVYTVEHVQGWLRENPPSRRALSPAQDLELNSQQGETSSSLRQATTEPSVFRCWSASKLRPTVTVVREVEDDNQASDEDGEDDEDDDSSEVSWNESDTSEDTAFAFPSKDRGLWLSDNSPAVTTCRYFASGEEKTAESWAELPKLLSVAHCRELATMIRA